MQLHDLQREHKNKTKKRIGRGGLRGKTSGKGHKGQKAHGGHGIRPVIRDMIKKLPKLRGYRFSSIKQKAIPVNLNVLEINFDNKETVSPQILAKKNIIRINKGRTPNVKILGEGKLTKKLIISGCSVSRSALEQIEKVGGNVTK